MKVLLYSWDAYSERGLYKALGEMGHKVLIYSKKIKNHLMDEEFLTELALLLVQERVELVISYDFFPMVSMACRAAHIKYASWIFGTPHYSLYCDAVFYEGNYIFCFDYMQYQMVQQIGAEHVYHLPLAVEPALFEASIRAQKVRPVGDVSFVGMLYTGDGNYFEQIAEMPNYMKGYIEGLCEAQLKVYGYNMVSDVMTEEIMQEMRKYVNFQAEPGFFLTFEQFVIDIINKKITVMERSRILERLSGSFEVDLYTKSDTSHLLKLRNHGYIHYYDEMPSVFRYSKMNLNITMRCITTGIPLRVLDVLGCRGFLLTNYQEEIAEYFEDGKDLVMYTSMEELVDKASFYLKEDGLREQIAQNGYAKVVKDFSYRKQLSLMMDQVTK